MGMKRKNLPEGDLESTSDWKGICTQGKISLEWKFVKEQNGTFVKPWLELKLLNQNILQLLHGKMFHLLEVSPQPVEL